ncbi:hypothetical protein LWI29_034433 [Acer saccharum]|uniref:Uncharacterized protein n=1 Tax=Acer saccharum TaxID=4024 RepID=A0AA39TJ68_ACESA|nr:hypothetical protein LWI29_034433 [Acer saccharum]
MLEHFAQMQAVCEQVNSAKSIEREYHALKSKVSDDGVLDKSLEAKLVQWQAKGRFLFSLLSTPMNLYIEINHFDLKG